MKDGDYFIWVDENGNKDIYQFMSEGGTTISAVSKDGSEKILDIYHGDAFATNYDFLSYNPNDIQNPLSSAPPPRSVFVGYNKDGTQEVSISGYYESPYDVVNQYVNDYGLSFQDAEKKVLVDIENGKLRNLTGNFAEVKRFKNQVNGYDATTHKEDYYFFDPKVMHGNPTQKNKEKYYGLKPSHSYGIKYDEGYYKQEDIATQKFTDEYGKDVEEGERINWGTTSHMPYGGGRLNLDPSEVASLARVHKENNPLYNSRNYGSPDNVLEWSSIHASSGAHTFADAYDKAFYSYRSNGSKVIDEFNLDWKYKLESDCYYDGRDKYDLDYSSDISKLRTFFDGVQSDIGTAEYGEELEAMRGIVDKFDANCVKCFNAPAPTEWFKSLLHEFKGYIDTNMSTLENRWEPIEYAVKVINGVVSPYDIPYEIRSKMDLPAYFLDDKELMEVNFNGSMLDVTRKENEKYELEKEKRDKLVEDIDTKEKEKKELEEKLAKKEEEYNTLKNNPEYVPFYEVYGDKKVFIGYTKELDPNYVNRLEALSNEIVQLFEDLQKLKEELEKLNIQLKEIEEEVAKKKRIVGRLIIMTFSLLSAIKNYNTNFGSFNKLLNTDSYHLGTQLPTVNSPYIDRSGQILTDLNDYDKYPVISSVRYFSPNDVVMYRDGDGRRYKVISVNEKESYVTIACVNKDGEIVGSSIEVRDPREIAIINR